MATKAQQYYVTVGVPIQPGEGAPKAWTGTVWAASPIEALRRFCTPEVDAEGSDWVSVTTDIPAE